MPKPYTDDIFRFTFKIIFKCSALGCIFNKENEKYAKYTFEQIHNYNTNNMEMSHKCL